SAFIIERWSRESRIEILAKRVVHRPCARRFHAGPYLPVAVAIPPGQAQCQEERAGEQAKETDYQRGAVSKPVFARGDAVVGQDRLLTDQERGVAGLAIGAFVAVLLEEVAVEHRRIIDAFT